MKNKQLCPSFLIEIKSKEHQSWQGVLTWIEGKEKKSFRSALELIRLLDSAMEKDEED